MATASRATGGSARLLKVPTFAGALSDCHAGQGRVVTLSMKRASAAMLAGQKADVGPMAPGRRAEQLDGIRASRPSRPRCASSMPNPVEEDFGKAWSRMGKAKDYKYDGRGLGEKPPPEWDPKFPHMLQPRSTASPTTFFYEAWDESPFADAYVGADGRRGCRRLKLGQGPATDYLAISFSSLDVVGHDFGPRSHEIQDMLLRLDDTLGEVCSTDARQESGPALSYVLAFTADHGVATIPEQAEAEGKDAGRLKMTNIMALTDRRCLAEVRRGRWVADPGVQRSSISGRASSIAADRPIPICSRSVIHGPSKRCRACRRDRRPHAGRAARPAVRRGRRPRGGAKSYFPGRSGDLSSSRSRTGSSSPKTRRSSPATPRRTAARTTTTTSACRWSCSAAASRRAATRRPRHAGRHRPDARAPRGVACRRATGHRARRSRCRGNERGRAHIATSTVTASRGV